MKNTVSVIIAAYNEERHIAECVESLFIQTRHPDEIIVVDDGSVDSTWEKLKNLKLKYPEINIYRKKHVEQATARNFGFKRSRGNIIVLPDADHRFDKRYIEKLTEPIIQKKAVATFTKEEYVANTTNRWARCWNINHYLPPTERIRPDFPDFDDNPRAILREIYKKAKGYKEEGYISDVTLLRKVNEKAISAKGAKVYHFNPDTLGIVFQKSFRMGYKGAFKLNLTNFILFSFPNSIRKGIKQGIKEGNIDYLIFKLVFDFGVTWGLLKKLMNR